MKRDTPPGAMREGGVHCCSSALERANFADCAGASPGDCPLQGCRVVASQELIDIAAILRLLLSAWGSARGPLVCESDRLHAKVECAGETDLPHLVSENFSKSGKLLETGRPSPAVSPCADSGWVQSFASMSCRMHWCRCTVTLCVVAEDVVVRVLCGLRNLLSWVVRVLCSLHSVLELRRRRQVVVYIVVMLILSLHAFCLACHQLTVIALCLTSLTVVARCMRV